MKKITNLILYSLCLIFGGLIFSGSAKAYSVPNNTLTVPGNTCITSEADAKKTIETANNGTMNPLLIYKYGDKYYLNDKGEVYRCNNGDMDIITDFEGCVVDGYYTDANYTNRIYPKYIKDVPGFGIKYNKDSNGCIKSVTYITTLYVKCKTTQTTTTVTPKPTPSTTTSTPVVSKDEPANPETGDMIWLYIGAGIILVAGCGIVFKKLTAK